LAEAEVKGERHAGLLLGQKLKELRRTVLCREDSLMDSLVLEWIKDLAYLRPNDALLIVDDLLDRYENPPDQSDIQHHPSNNWQFKNTRFLLKKVIDVLSYTYLEQPHPSIDYLYKLAQYQSNSPEYARIREEANTALLEIGKITRNKPYTVQLTLLDKIEEWLEGDYIRNLELSLSLIQPMFSMEIDLTTTDPTKYLHIIIRHGTLAPCASLRQVREKALSILYQLYNKAYSLSERLKVVKVLEEILHLYSSVNFNEISTKTRARLEFDYHNLAQVLLNKSISQETRTWLELDCRNIAQFLLSKVVYHAELPILDAVAKWLWYALRFSRYPLNEFEQLKQQLQNNELYQLYCVLVRNRLRGDSKDELENREVIDQRHLQAIEQYVEKLSPLTIKQAIYDLETIVEQSFKAGEIETSWFGTLFFMMGEKHPNLAEQLIEQTLSENLTLKYYLGHLIGGLERTEYEGTWSYINSWANSNDPILWLAATKSYHFRNWSQFQDQEWGVLYDLITKKDCLVDCEIIELIARFGSLNPQRAINFLKIFANRGSERMILQVAEVLSMSFEPVKDRRGAKLISSDDLLEIINNFERLSRFDYNAEICLNRLGQIAPMQLIDFIEHRLIQKKKYHKKGEYYYKAVHFSYSIAMDSIRSSPEYPNILRRVRDWMLREDIGFDETPGVLVEIAGSLEEPLYGVLMEWVKSGDVQKLGAIAKILQKFNSGQLFYNLCREIISRTKTETILGSIRNCILSTTGTMFLGSGFSNFYRERLEEITPWLEDENFRVSHFAKEMEEFLQQEINRALEREAFEQHHW
jgi:hypothetical protein